jgi:hypothetical protein
VQVEPPDLRRRHIHIVFAAEIVEGRLPEEAVAIRQHFEHALGEEQAAFLRARAKDRHEQVLMAEIRCAGNPEVLGDLRQLGNAEIPKVREL